ncbi:MAG: (d)CMP kinase [Chitinispirillaceae bacterium]|nr:(d)CMP kinase [Chitinispirillaceae bacterium]
MIIAIDGPAGSGKSSTAKAVAAHLGITYLDTGAMYRVITLKCLRAGIPVTDEKRLSEVSNGTIIAFTGIPPQVSVWMDGEDVSSAIRSDEVTKNVSDYCAPTVVREALVNQQRRIAEGRSIICEGRDIATVVFPKAELKIYMIASVEERAKRRLEDFKKLGVEKNVEELMREIEIRDQKDSSRKNSPLMKADDAIMLDTTGMTLDQQIEWIVEKARALQ